MSGVAVHHHFLRFSQAITGALCAEALIFRSWLPIAVALALVLLNLVAPRVSPVTFLFRFFSRAPQALRPAAPVRFSQALTAVALAAALAVSLLELRVAGAVVVGLVAAVALISAINGICLGCELYRMLRRPRAADGDVRAELGLEGEGPWVALLTAPGCPACEPALASLRELAKGDGAPRVIEVDVAQRPGAALAARLLPAAIAVGEDGRVRVERAAPLKPDHLHEVVASLRPAPGAA